MSKNTKTQSPQVDFIGKGQSQGEVAGAIANNSGMNPGALKPFVAEDGKPYITVYQGGDVNKKESYGVKPVTNATLRRDEWKQLDDSVQKVAEYRLGGVQDLLSNNLTFPLGDPMGTTVLEWHDVSDALEAELTMDGVNRAEGDRPSYGTNYLPIPILHADYEINERVLKASRNQGNPLDTTLAERAARKVQEKLENLLFSATQYSFAGGTIYSYLNYPQRNKVSLGTAWDSSSATAVGIVDNVRNMKQQAIESHFYGPFVIYVPTAYETVLDDDYDTSGTSTQTIRQRIEAINGIQSVKVIDSLPADNVVMVQMSPDVVRLVDGMSMQNVEWQKEGNLITKYKVMSIRVPQIRSDQEGNCGIVHLS